MPKPILVIVESPAKAKKIKGFYKDKSIVVKSSFGHIYDLDKSDLSVDIHNNFKPRFYVSFTFSRNVSK